MKLKELHKYLHKIKEITKDTNIAWTAGRTDVIAKIVREMNKALEKTAAEEEATRSEVLLAMDYIQSKVRLNVAIAEGKEVLDTVLKNKRGDQNDYV